MNFLYYFKYFFFISKNWNPKLALFTVYHEIKGEKKYGINTIRIDRLHHLKIESENLIHSSIYQGANYFVLEKAFNFLKNININNSIVDFGCGKGRILAVAAFYGFKNITGIDFSPELCNAAQKNIVSIKANYPSTNFSVICLDAVNYKIQKDTQVFFFFNPFDEVVTLAVAKNILASLKENQRRVYIVYVNPLHKEIFQSAGFQEEYYLKKMEYIELSILSNDRNDTE
jgi:SAM-dependent methyltransferase